jgi:hypothetical protein
VRSSIRPGSTDTWDTNNIYQRDGQDPSRKNCHDMGSAISNNADFKEVLIKKI